MKPKVFGSLAALVIISAMAGVVHWRFGSIATAGAYFRGDQISVDKAVQQLGTVEPDQLIKVTFNLTNLQSEPIKIVGANTSCSCVLPPEIPITLPPFVTTPFTLNFTSPGTEQEFAQVVNLYLDGPLLPVRLKLSGATR